MHYDDFVTQHDIYETFAYDCFKRYTKDWTGYPGIEGISFTHKGMDLNYSFYDNKDNLHVPVEFMQKFDVSSVVKLWEQIKLDEQEMAHQKAIVEQSARDLAEFNRLKEKLGKSGLSN